MWLLLTWRPQTCVDCKKTNELRRDGCHSTFSDLPERMTEARDRLRNEWRQFGLALILTATAIPRSVFVKR